MTWKKSPPKGGEKGSRPSHPWPYHFLYMITILHVTVYIVYCILRYCTSLHVTAYNTIYCIITVDCILCNLYGLYCIMYHAYDTFNYYIGGRLCKYFEYVNCVGNIKFAMSIILKKNVVKFCWIWDPPKVHHLGVGEGWGRRHGGIGLAGTFFMICIRLI